MMKSHMWSHSVRSKYDLRNFKVIREMRDTEKEQYSRVLDSNLEGGKKITYIQDDPWNHPNT